MASNTENLNLLMKNPSTDGADTFNVQTMLNENWQKIDENAGTVAQALANILKPTTPPIIGLPPSTTPDGMFQALGNTGELHVWRKTVVVGSYYIGATQPNYGCICRNTGSASFGVKIQYASEITVDSHENRNLVSPSDMTIIANNSGITSPSATSVANTLKGKFIRLAGIPDGYQNSELRYAVGSVFYCPESVSCFVKDAFSDGNYYICLDGIKNVPTKTENVVTYPVSTNHNAYQEGDDAKAAGYVLGDVVMGNFKMGVSLYVATNDFYYVDTPNVSDDGVVSVPTENTSKISVGYKTDFDASTLNVLRGKFVMCSGDARCDAIFYSVIYIPADATFTKSDWGDDGYTYYLNKYQPVTGYAAIPAGTTIEYLGKLGDKARVQVVSYVGTGTYGVNNKNSLTFDFPPKILLIAMAQLYSNQTYTGILYPFVGYGSSLLGSDRGYVYSLLCNRNGNSVSWWNKDDYGNQLNISGYKYTAIAIG